MRIAFEIISIGNELLIGKIVNTNAQWLARYITRLGGDVRRITVIRDEISEISSALREALSRGSSFIITTGGLGPTFDDKTLEAVSLALEKPLELNEEALLIVKEKYHNYEEAVQKRIELTPARLKMAKLPRDSRPLPNPVGTAPGVYSEYSTSKIINLPGVPSEMKAIFEESVVPVIKKFVKKTAVYEKSFKVTGIIESELAPLIEEVMRENPKVYIKSHPRAAEPNPLIELHISTISNSVAKAEEWVRLAEKRFSCLIEEIGGKMEQLSP